MNAARSALAPRDPHHVVEHLALLRDAGAGQPLEAAEARLDACPVGAALLIEVLRELGEAERQLPLLPRFARRDERARLPQHGRLVGGRRPGRGRHGREIAPQRGLARAQQRFGLRTIDSLDVSETGGQLRGGNILMDEAGRCYSAGFRHPLYEATFKCTKTITFPCRSDVCHTDEYVTFLKNDTAITNQQEFVPALKEAGGKNIRLVPYDVHLSLANVLIVNDTVFMMYLDHVKDKMLQAKSVFEREGYKVIPINSGGAGRQYGAVHCLTKEIPE